YDADIPEYALAVDLYQTLARDGSTGLLHAHVQEYAPPDTIEPTVARRRRIEALAVIREDLELPRERVHLKRRERQRGSSQYEKQAEEGHEWIVAEGRAKLYVNFDDYLDTGLFLDHRPLRLELGAAESPLVAGKRFLNLFCYTGAMTVQAALGGARSTTSVDLSRPYLEWAKRNLALNGVTAVGPEPLESRGRRSPLHQLIRDDVVDWLGRQGATRWDVILCDPPSFSNSKRMADSFDVQRDHVELIRRCVGLLAPGGLLIFSTNKRRFNLDQDALADLKIEPHRATVPPDFVRSPEIHRAWMLRK
ncbi:MAG: class I SAM-dependent methyltransferase, partial [Myxococcales bacterium]|nr:class I SAM-dependent methyltransferase [Myxococcales bacterium]